MAFAIIGNCSYSALVEDGAVRWLCWPRMDSSFVFGDLLDADGGGEFSVTPNGRADVIQQYLENTNVLRTLFRAEDGVFEVIDFAPRFRQHERYYKPSTLVRIIRPIEGQPVVRVACRPVYDYGRVRASSWVASNHIEFTGLPAPLRLTTDLSLTHVQEGRPFALVKKQHLALTWGEPLESPLESTLDRFLNETVRYWRQWVKHTRIPRDYQEAVIRSALALKLHQFEDTGALIAATTTSIPEHPGSGRTWDYRFCWLRDTYFTLNALEKLGHLEEMERFLNFLRDLCALHKDSLQPLYGINGEAHLQEQVLEHLAGYRGEKPVRIGNQAIEHVQNDVYGEMILAVRRVLLDKRFGGTEGIEGTLHIIEHLLGQIEQRLEQPDAGLWELRSEQKVHAFTLLMHWAGARSVETVGEILGNDGLTARSAKVRRRAQELLLEKCWDPKRGVLTQAVGAKNLDAAMLLALQLGFLDGDDPRARTHVEAIREQLSIDGGFLRRYDVEDDFGVPRAAFTVCSFWLAEALGIVGRVEEGRELFERLLAHDNGMGLFSEDILPEDGSQSGNFPQTYSHVGLIHAAFQLSRPWD